MYVEVSHARQLFIGLSGEHKPAPGDEDLGTIEIGARLLEVDTGKEFVWFGQAERDGSPPNSTRSTSTSGKWYGWPRTDLDGLLTELCAGIKEISASFA